MNKPMFSVKKQRFIAQLYCYGFVGIASNLAGYMVYLLVTYLGATPKITMSLLYGVGAAAGFWGNRNITFSHKGKLLATGARYFIAHCIGYTINLVILVIMVDKFGYAHQMVQAAAVFIVAIFLFLALKYFVFKEQSSLVIRGE